MKITKQLVAQLVLEAIDKAKKEKNLPKNSGKLIDLKKNLAALEKMKIELSTAKFAEKTASTEVEYADLAKFAKELDLIKSKGVALEQKIDNQINLLKSKIEAETTKIKELMGLTPQPGQKELVDNQEPNLDNE